MVACKNTCEMTSGGSRDGTSHSNYQHLPRTSRELAANARRSLSDSNAIMERTITELLARITKLEHELAEANAHIDDLTDQVRTPREDQEAWRVVDPPEDDNHADEMAPERSPRGQHAPLIRFLPDIDKVQTTTSRSGDGYLVLETPDPEKLAVGLHRINWSAFSLRMKRLEEIHGRRSVNYRRAHSRNQAVEIWLDAELSLPIPVAPCRRPEA